MIKRLKHSYPQKSPKQFFSIEFSIEVILGLVVLINSTITVVHALEISEIFFNPEGNDNNKEFIEIFIKSNETNLTKYILNDSTSSDLLIPLQETNSNIALIVEEGFNYSDLNCSIYSVGQTIGNNLNNNADSIKISYPNGTQIATTSYKTPNTFISGTSLSFYLKEFKNNTLENRSFYDSPSPCRILVKQLNNIIKNETNSTRSTNSSSLNFFNTTNTSKPLDHNSSLNTSIQQDNQSNEIKNYSIEILSLYYFNETKITYSFSISPETPTHYSITYWITDLEGKIVKNKITTRNTYWKRYSPRIHKHTTAFVIHAVLTIFNEQQNIQKTDSTKRIVFYISKQSETQTKNDEPRKNIKTNSKESQTNSQISIQYVYDKNHILFGNNVTFKLKLCNNNGIYNKNIVSTSIFYEEQHKEKTIKKIFASNSFKFFKDSFAVLSQQITLQKTIPKLCKTSLNATLEVRGFETYDSIPIVILCPEINKKNTNQNRTINSSNSAFKKIKQINNTKKVISRRINDQTNNRFYKPRYSRATQESFDLNSAIYTQTIPTFSSITSKILATNRHKESSITNPNNKKNTNFSSKKQDKPNKIDLKKEKEKEVLPKILFITVLLGIILLARLRVHFS